VLTEKVQQLQAIFHGLFFFLRSATSVGMSASAPASQEIALSQPPVQKRKFGGPQPIPVDGRKYRQPKTKLAPITRASLDGRSLSARQFDAIVSAIRSDCGASDTLSAVQLAMMEAFAGLTVQLDTLNADVLLGKPVDRAAYCGLVTAMVRVGSRLGVKRKSRDVTTSLAAYLDNPERPEAPEDGERPPRIGREPPAGGGDDE
jgi:hypothetical protein